MRHSTSSKFRSSYEKLPPHVQRSADKSFALLESDPRHPSLRLKKVGRFWSVWAGNGYRAIGVDIEGGILWIWIGTHDEYERIIRS
jgi:hypothetical protein